MGWIGLAISIVLLVGCGNSAPPPASTGANPALIPEAKAPPPGSTADEKTCQSCHAEEHKFWDYGGHAEISCKDCHEVGGNHEENDEKPVLGGNAQCLGCHALVEGQGSENLSEADVFEHHMKFLEKKHVIEVDRKKGSRRCVDCHDPHLGQ